MNSLTRLSKQAKKYIEMNDDKKREFIDEAYNKENLSYGVIAKMCGTYVNRIRRDALKLGFESRDKSEAQKLALATGRTEHPTEGKGHSEETKLKLSDKIGEVWDNLTDEERERRSKLSKDYWESMGEHRKKEMNKVGCDAVRETAKVGSKLELYLRDELNNAGYKINFHRKYLVQNHNLHIDITIPNPMIAIEVDGPSHFKPIWGEEAFQRTRATDEEKNALLLAKGWAVVRVQQRKKLTGRYMRHLRDCLLSVITELENKFPEDQTKRFFVLGE